MMSDDLENAIAEIYEAAVSGQVMDQLAEIIARNAGGRSCVVRKTDGDLRPIAMASLWFTPEMLEAYVDDEIYLDDIWANWAVERGIYDQAGIVSEMVGRERYERTRFFQDLIRKFGDDSGHCLGALLRRSEGGFFTYGTHRAARAETFTTDEARRINLLNPHLMRALRIDEKLAQDRQEACNMRVALDRLERPLVTVHPSLKVALVNAAAEAIAARGDGLVFRAGQLTALDPVSRRRLAEMLDAALRHKRSQGGSLRIERRGGKPPYRLTIAPAAVNGVNHAMVLIDDPDNELIDAADHLRNLYDFTSAEAEVALLVAKGHSTEEIATARDVGVATVKTLLQRCFRKSDTKRATQLARLVNRLPR